MRVLICAPWFRTLAQLHGRELERRGHEVLVLATPAHPEGDYGFVTETLLPERLRSRAWLPAFMVARGAVKRFAPTVVLLDETWDVRFLALLPHAPRLLAIHDATPHDVAQTKARWQRAVLQRLRATSGARIAFSAATAAELGGCTRHVPLTSEMPDERAPDTRRAADRRDFVLLGRVHPYKNVPHILRAWHKHRRSEDWAGDRLVLLGAGAARYATAADEGCGVLVRDGGYTFSEGAALLAKAKASLCVYERASQSGAQIFSMQCGTGVISSTAGALPDTQPPGSPVVDPDDVDQLVAAFADMSRCERAAHLGVQARAHYEAHHSQAHVGSAIESELNAVRAVR